MTENYSEVCKVPAGGASIQCEALPPNVQQMPFQMRRIGWLNLFGLDALVNMVTDAGLHIEMRILEAV
jgi:hypothetical protein